MAIYKCEDGCFVISAYGVWRPGTYTTEKACRMAQRRSDETLIRLQEHANARVGGTGGTITEDDLKGAAK